MKRLAWLALRLIFTAALLAWAFHDRTLRAQLAALPMPANTGWLVAAWLAAGLGETVGLLRFWCCLHLAGVPLPLRRAAALHFAGLFTSLFLPGMAGGDALKIALVGLHFPQRKFGGLLAVLMDRLSGFVVITLWAMLMAWTRADWFAQSSVAATALRAVLFTAGPLAAALILWFLLSRTRLMRTRIRRFPFRERVIQCEACFDVLVGDRPRTLAVLLASIAGFAAYFMIFHYAALAYGIPLVWRDTLSVMPMLDLITMLPVTVAGLGLREQAFQWILAPLCGIAPAQGVIVSLAGFFVASTWALLGASVFLGLRPALKPGWRCFEPAARLAVTLGSSFLGCPTHHGFLRELVRGGWTPGLVSGCSTGAIVAGLYAAGVSLEAMEDLFTHRTLSSHFYEWQTPFRALGTLLGVPGCPSIFHGKKLGSLLAELVGDMRIEDCATASLHIAVTNLRTSRVEMRDRGPLAETILASCAMPGVIVPRKIEGELLWDGALGSSVPVEPFLENEAITHLAAHSIVFEKQIRARERSHRYNFAGAMLAGNQLTADELLHWKLELARRAGKTVASAETVTPRPRLGPPLTLPPPKPWPEYARDFMRFGATSARRVITDFTAAAETPAAGC